jgi:hypothetical protein
MAKEMEDSVIAAMKHSELSASGEQGGHVQRAHVIDADSPDTVDAGARMTTYMAGLGTDDQKSAPPLAWRG